MARNTPPAGNGPLFDDRSEEGADALASKPRRRAPRKLGLVPVALVAALVGTGLWGAWVTKALLADPGLPVRMVRASRGKWLRAEPVAMLYAQGRVRHAGAFRELEDQMCDFTADGLASGRSPDRLDALVWALHELALKNRGEPKIRAT